MTCVTTKEKPLNTPNLSHYVGNTDIYLIDQILKNRYHLNEKILDAGCGKGRNLHWFYHQGFQLFGIDKNGENIHQVKKQYPRVEKNFLVSTIEQTPFPNEEFHHIICNAVFHFAQDENHFLDMFAEMFRLLKPNGSLFIRMASNFVLKDKMIALSNGRCQLPDGTQRFLLTKTLLNKLQNKHHFSYLETIKTTNVNDVRSMTTLVIKSE